jgi:peptidoglycan/LPS O-acetylase OafA/YrhL
LKSPNIKYLPGLDHLRAFAVLLVIFYHGYQVLFLLPMGQGELGRVWPHTLKPFYALMIEGHTAVTLFMVLSGFVLSVSSIGKDIAWGPFVKNRLLRIYPLYLFLLALGTAAYARDYSFLGVLQLLLVQGDYQGAAAAGTVFQMFWAVAVEFQFYLLFPFMHRFLERDGWRWGLGLIALVMICRYCVLQLSPGTEHDLTYWHLIGRLDQFVIGMLAARVFHRFQHARTPWWLWSTLAFAATLALLVGFNNLGGWPMKAWWRIPGTSLEGLAWATVIVTYVPTSRSVPALLSRPLATIGTWSYSLYLLHWSAIHVAMSLAEYHRTGGVAAQWFIVTHILPGLLPVAALSYYVIERPFLALRVKYHRPAREPSGPEANPNSIRLAS